MEIGKHLNGNAVLEIGKHLKGNAVLEIGKHLNGNAVLEIGKHLKSNAVWKFGKHRIEEYFTDSLKDQMPFHIDLYVAPRSTAVPDGESWISSCTTPFAPKGGASGAHRIGGWVGSRTGKQIPFALAGIWSPVSRILT